MLQPTLIEEHAGTAHDPTAAVGELVDLRDQRCTGIGCNHPAHRCDRDHENAYPDGPTAAWNLSSKSPRCHHAKHHGGTVVRNENTGVSTWRSPLGHTYQRPSVWHAPPQIPKDAVLPPPALPSQPKDEDRDRDERWDSPLALPEPTPKPSDKPQLKAPGQGWNDGEPPF